MTQEYLQDFIREAEEQITDLNNALVSLESDPDNHEAVDQIFRIAHTLKGNAGAMGFDSASNLAHAIEDLLDEIREDRLAVTAEVMDLIFAGVDHIEVILREIEADGSSSTDPTELVAEIRNTIDVDNDSSLDRDVDSGGESSSVGAVRRALTVIDDDSAFTSGDERLIHALIDLSESQMPSVDAMLLLESVEEDPSVTLVGTVPDRSSVEHGEFDGTFDLFVGHPTGDCSSLESLLSKSVDAVDPNDITDGIHEAYEEPANERNPEKDRNEHDVVDNAAKVTGTAESSEKSDSPSESSSPDQQVKSVRVDVERLDELHGLVEQLVTSRIKLRRAVEQDDKDGASSHLDELDKITSSLQNTVMDMQLIPLKKVVGKFPRLVRDVARDVDKEVTFDLSGENVELDRTILTEISDPLMHILRNAVDHGIEPPEIREEKGKPRAGHVSLRAERQRDQVIIEVEDDGAGLDVEGIRKSALEKGVRSAEELESMDDSAVYNLIFHPGFSTSDEVTDVSGRGVGMDVVHSTVSRLDGNVSVESEPDDGTVVTLRVPVTVAIVNVLFVEVGDEEYGIPIKTIDAVNDSGSIDTVNGRELVEYGDDLYQVIRLGEALDVDGPTLNGDGMLLRIRKSARKVALHCDRVRKQEEVVVKPMDGILSGIEGIGGTAVLGDGQIVPIIDVKTL